MHSSSSSPWQTSACCPSADWFSAYEVGIDDPSSWSMVPDRLVDHRHTAAAVRHLTMSSRPDAGPDRRVTPLVGDFHSAILELEANYLDHLEVDSRYIADTIVPRWARSARSPTHSEHRRRYLALPKYQEILFVDWPRGGVELVPTAAEGLRMTEFFIIRMRVSSPRNGSCSNSLRAREGTNSAAPSCRMQQQVHAPNEVRRVRRISRPGPEEPDDQHDYKRRW